MISKEHECIKVLITSCQGDVKSWLLIFCFYNRGEGGGGGGGD